MTVLITEADVRTLMASRSSMGEAIRIMEDVFVEQAHDRLALIPRVEVDYPRGSAGETAGRSLRMLPCIIPSLNAAAVRIYTTNKVGDARRAAPAELILLFDHETMELRAIIEDYSLHALRTAAPSGVATRHLARADASRVGVLGSGRHARGQLAAVASVRALTQVDVYSPHPERRVAFARETADTLGVPVVPHSEPEPVVRAADILVVATTTTEPIVRGEWLAPGVHVNSIAPCELDVDTVLRARLFMSSTIGITAGARPWPPISELLQSGGIRPEQLEAELCAVVAGQIPGRSTAEDVTVFIAEGLPSWDVAIAVWAEDAARRAGLGRELWQAGATRSMPGLVPPLASPDFAP